MSILVKNRKICIGSFFRFIFKIKLLTCLRIEAEVVLKEIENKDWCCRYIVLKYFLLYVF
ncbi:hypothetical protein Calab_1799 [Caldithrix abyssi DSM 13497]|uniref:Uncharacterized protein n=1 Tax=Caldithrix abyssi DSM 13497 TaxID=880073 RepID=H1XSY6_CALAY|nr:hypothetical protein Cabys_542 [Caldithrix abyssi DSM 13497]EHO41415.1 hypothetical protein Calab_1799 [Caldithrix abyssi DSM 13497]